MEKVNAKIKWWVWSCHWMLFVTTEKQASALTLETPFNGHPICRTLKDNMLIAYLKKQINNVDFNNIEIVRNPEIQLGL